MFDPTGRRLAAAAVAALAAISLSATAVGAAPATQAAPDASASQFKLIAFAKDILVHPYVSIFCVIEESAYADATPTAANVRSLEAATLCLVNDLRVQNGLSRLVSNAPMTNSARTHSQDMVNQKNQTHNRLGGDPSASDLGWNPSGENIGWGCGSPTSAGTPRAVVNSWFNEAPPNDGHRRNILSPHFTVTGVGVAYGAPTEGNCANAADYTQDFGGLVGD